jgi:hypothetical protein
MHRRPPPTTARPLLATREHRNRYGDDHLARCLFLLDTREDRLIGAYHQGVLLDEQKAQRLWHTHQWATDQQSAQGHLQASRPQPQGIAAAA